PPPRPTPFPYTTLFRSTVMFPIPTKVEPLRATSVTAQMRSFHWKSKSVLVAIVTFFKGTGFINDGIRGQRFDLTKEINDQLQPLDRKSTRLNSSHVSIS